MAGDRLEDQILERLATLGDITARPMFGGQGLYWGETIFGIVYRDKLYFKVGEDTKPDYLARGMEPFRPNQRQTLRSYFEVPPDVLGDPESLLSWAGEAIRAGLSSSKPG